MKMKLEQKGISFDEINDINLMKEMGFAAMPMLDIDGKILNFTDAVEYLNTKTKGE